MGDPKREALELALSRWGRAETARIGDRDALVLAAIAAGIPKLRVHQLTGLSRATIDRILKGDR